MNRYSIISICIFNVGTRLRLKTVYLSYHAILNVLQKNKSAFHVFKVLTLPVILWISPFPLILVMRFPPLPIGAHVHIDLSCRY